MAQINPIICGQYANHRYRQYLKWRNKWLQAVNEGNQQQADFYHQQLICAADERIQFSKLANQARGMKQ
ncbi:hypothetical protein [Avibacterium paragallinarum]|uniref:hypothetical protein n=1 Tax=Avibacterium paragallinarum TaxID=728 RepID=UPI00021ACE54|nr:hypothetical protein [Avibacterium paragallinarum]QIR10955.1 hypothetical protein HBL79_01020 [Avibacterium paragallinarum]QLD64068.1 hypothetical protein VY92_001140 [Avibacterium paragallinarum]